MVLHGELLLDHARQDRRGPDAGVQTVRHRTTFHDVVEVPALLLGQCAGATTAVTFLESFRTVLIPAANPGMDARAVDMEQVGNPRGRIAVGTEQNRLQA
jgi:hypothetical protein